MLRNVNKDDFGNFTAYDETGRRVFISESISLIFKVEVNEEHNSVRYVPITYKDTTTLTVIERYLMGKTPTGRNALKMENIVIRFGWMDKRLNKLSFIGLDVLMERIRSGQPEVSDKGKLQQICKQLSLSQKRVMK